jgi:hypothetical protein
MRSLAAHLQDADGHDRLPFHPSCPICRQARLTGTITADAALSLRTQAVLTAGVLAVSVNAPAAAALAAEQDQERDGTAPVAQNVTPDPADNPDFDPGGHTTDLPDATPGLPPSQASPDAESEDAALAEQPPATDLDDPVVDAGDRVDRAPAPVVTPSPAGSAPTTGTTTSQVVRDTSSSEPAPSPRAAAETAPVAEAAPAAPEPRALADTRRSPNREAAQRKRTRPSSHSSSAHASTASALATRTAPALTSTRAAPLAPAPVSGREARPGDRTHTVLAGESLWAIASDILGHDATPARVAREVHRLWQLNRERIGTGDPDLLLIGTKLTLR